MQIVLVFNKLGQNACGVAASQSYGAAAGLLWNTAAPVLPHPITRCNIATLIAVTFTAGG